MIEPYFNGKLSYKEIRSGLSTGDLVLSSGSSVFSKLIKELMGCKYSHLAMVVWGHDVGLSPGRLYCWEATGRGVGEVSWEQSIYTPRTDFLSRLVNPGAGDLAVRLLHGRLPSDAIDKFRAHRLDMIGREYERNKIEMLKACFPSLASVFHKANQQDLTSIFCWECVAAAWQAMGILPSDRSANSYPILDFVDGGKLPLQQGVSLGMEIPVEP